MRKACLLVLALTLSATTMRAGAAGDREQRIARLKDLLATHPGNAKVLLRLGCQYVFRADETERPEAIVEARHTLNEALQAGCGPEARAWLGLLRCIEAKFGSGATARALAVEGLTELDAAVEASPENLKFRMMRASVSLRVPREWKRLEQAKEDLLIAAAAVRRDASRLRTYDVDPAELYFKLGQAHLGAGELPEARAAWEHAKQTGAEGRWAREADRLLRRHGS